MMPTHNNESRNSNYFHSFFTGMPLRVNSAEYSAALQAYLQEIDDLPTPFDAQTQRSLLARVSHGDTEAERLLVESNLRLVLVIARRYQGRGLQLIDLIQEGNKGLLYAIQHFDGAKSSRLSTYATIRIVHSIGRAVLEQAKVLDFSYSTGQAIQRIKLAVDSFLERGIEPSLDEIVKRSGLAQEQVLELLPIMSEPVRIDSQVDEDEPLGATLVDRSMVPSYEAETSALFSEVIEVIDQVLTENQAAVLKLRYGITDGIVYGYEEIANKLWAHPKKRTFEYVKLLEKQAIDIIQKAFERKEDTI